MIKISISSVKKILEQSFRYDYLITKDYLCNKFFDRKKQYKSDSKPIAFIVAGGIASGKSTWCRAFLDYYEKENLPFLSNDIAQATRYKSDENNSESYNSARRYVYRSIDFLIKNRITFVWETVLSKIKKVNVINKLKANNYHIVLFCLRINPKVAIERSNKREMLGARSIDEVFILNRNARSDKYFKYITSLVDEIYIISNDTKPELVYGQDGKDTYRSERF